MSSWLERRRQKQEEQSQDWPASEPSPDRGSSQPPRETDWEAELRRLLGEPVDRPAPPPPPYTPEPVIPPPLPALGRRATPPPAPAQSMEEDEEGPAFDFPPMTAPARSLEEAGRVQERAEQRLREASANLGRSHHTSIVAMQAGRISQIARQHVASGIAAAALPSKIRHAESELSPEALAVLKMLRTPSGAKQAVLVSLVLGPPAAFRQEGF
ncbi:MAG: hypothetical protein FJ405_16280 [Verrucomicrobia bacterium]|nr:hypothetical protein [Verrucomicrobiota bacterium]